MKRASYPVDPFVLGLDIGHSTVKYKSPFAQGHFESVYGLEVTGIKFDGLATTDDFVIERNGQRIAIGRSVDNLGSVRVQTLDRARVLSDDYIILTQAALAASLHPYSGEVSPVFNLPVAWYERRNEVKAHLEGEHRLVYRGDELVFTLRADNIRTLPEGFAILCREMLDETGEVVNDEFENVSVGVVDVGMQTTDLSFYDRLALNQRMTRGFDVGLKQALEMAQRKAEQELNHFFTLEQIDRALNDRDNQRADRYLLYVGKYDVTDQVLAWFSEGMEVVAKAVVGHVRSLWQSGNAAQILLLGGGTGGKHAAPTLLDTFDHARAVANPADANADGAFRYGLMKVRESYVTGA